MEIDSDDETISEGVKVLMYKSQAQRPNERRNIRDKYQELIEDARKEKEKEELDADNVLHSMSQADELFKDVFTPQEAIYDARLVGIHSEIAKKHAHQIQVESPFNTDAFFRKLAYELTGTYTDADVNLDEKAWLQLGDRVFHMFNLTPKLNFMHGTFPEAEGHVSRHRRKKADDSKSDPTSVKVVASGSRTINTDKTYAEIQRIKKILSNIYKRNCGMPVCYFRFTVDPDSFSRTIENMFHLSFLIKEREVILSMDSNNLPVLEPFVQSGTGANTETSQTVLTMNVHKWKQIIEVFEIRKPSIPPSRYVMHDVS